MTRAPGSSNDVVRATDESKKEPSSSVRDETNPTSTDTTEAMDASSRVEANPYPMIVMKRQAWPTALPTYGVVVAVLFCLFIPESISFAIGSVKMTPLRIVGIWSFFAILVQGRVRWAGPDFIAFAGTLCTVVSISRSAGMGDTAEWVGRGFLDGAMIYFVGRYIGQTWMRGIWFLRIMISVLAVMALTTIVESVFRFNIHQSTWGLIGEVKGLFDEDRLGLLRARGWTQHPIMLGLIFAMYLPVALVMADRRHQAWGSHSLAIPILLALGAACSVSSAAMLAVLAGTGLYLWDTKLGGQAPGKWRLVYMGVPLFYLLTDVLMQRPLIRVLMSHLHVSSDSAWQYRWKLYQRAFDSMPGHWWMGYGSVTPSEFSRNSGWSVDNHYLAVLLTLGITGVFFWLLLMLSVLRFRPAKWGENHGPANSVARGLCLGLTVIVALQLTVAIFGLGSTHVWLLMGLATSFAIHASYESGRKGDWN